MSRILVTGANGFVGRSLIRLLLDSHEVCVLDLLRGGPLRFSPSERARFRFTRTDIRDVEALSEAVGGFAPEIVIHLAAIHFIPDCEHNPAEAVSTNVSGTVNLLQAAHRVGVNHFVFASSAAVYAPENAPHEEDHSPLGPADIYGITKLHCENYVRQLWTGQGQRATLIRLFNVVGPGETNPHLLPEIIAQMKAGRKTLRLGNTWPKRDYIDVEDAAEGFAVVALSNPVDAPKFDVVNLGTGVQHSVDEIVEKLSTLCEQRLQIERDHSRTRPVDRPYLVANVNKIAQRFGWRPKRTLDDSIARLWENPDFDEALRSRLAALNNGV